MPSKAVTCALFASILVATISQDVGASAAVKSGAPCKRVNQVIDDNNQKFRCTKKGNKKVWIKFKTIEAVKTPVIPSAPTETAAQESAKTEPGTSVETLQISVSPRDLATCRIPDQSPLGNRKEGPSIAYPVPTGAKYAQIPSRGEIRAAIIPIDFPDVPGKENPESIYELELKVIDDWMRWYSNGTSFFKWELGKKWLRAPRPSYDYVALDTPQFSQGNPIPGTKVGREINSVQIASEFYDLAAKDIDLRNLHTVLFLYPRDIQNIYDLIVRNASDQGLGDPSKAGFQPKVIDSRLLKVWIMSTGSFLYRNGYPLWSWVVHEVLHNLGLQGHAPNQGSILGIMTNQWGASFALNAWDTTVLDWQRPADVYCLEKQDLSIKRSVMLSPLEREEEGNKSVMIKLSSKEVLVIESHRRDKWSSGHLDFPGLPNDFKGIVVYKVDTSKTPLYGIVEPDGNDWKDSSEAFAYYIRKETISRGYLNTRFGRLDLNFVLQEGESISTNGVRIYLEKSSRYDTVNIEKTN